MLQNDFAATDFATIDMERKTHIRQGLFIGLVDNRHTRCLNGSNPHTNGQVCQYCQYKTIRPLPLRKKYKHLQQDRYPIPRSNYDLLSQLDSEIFDIKQSFPKRQNSENNCSIINRYTPKRVRAEQDALQ